MTDEEKEALVQQASAEVLSQVSDELMQYLAAGRAVVDFMVEQGVVTRGALGVPLHVVVVRMLMDSGLISAEDLVRLEAIHVRVVAEMDQNIAAIRAARKERRE